MLLRVPDREKERDNLEGRGDNKRGFCGSQGVPPSGRKCCNFLEGGEKKETRNPGNDGAERFSSPQRKRDLQEGKKKKKKV